MIMCENLDFRQDLRGSRSFFGEGGGVEGYMCCGGGGGSEAISVNLAVYINKGGCWGPDTPLPPNRTCQETLEYTVTSVCVDKMTY